MQGPEGTALEFALSGPLLTCFGDQQHLHMHAEGRGALHPPQHRLTDQPTSPDWVMTEGVNLSVENAVHHFQIRLAMRNHTKLPDRSLV